MTAPTPDETYRPLTGPAEMTRHAGKAFALFAVAAAVVVAALWASAPPASAGQHQNGSSYVQWQGQLPQTFGFSQDIVVNQMGPGSFWASNWQWHKSAVGGYIGVQRSGDPNAAANANGMVLFSLWNADRSQPGSAGTTCLSFGGEGVGLSCRLSMPVTSGATYRLSVLYDGQDATGNWWKGQIQTNGGAAVVLGRIHVPYRNLTTTPVNFIEYYGEATACDQTPFNDAAFLPPTNFGYLWAPSPTSFYSSSKLDCVQSQAIPVYGGAWARSGGPKPWMVPTPSIRAGASSVVASWRPPLSDGGSAVTGYVVQVSSDRSTWSTASSHAAPVTSTTINGLTPGRDYFVRVAARNAAGVGAWSFPSTAATATPGTNPTGKLESGFTAPGGTLTVRGWAADADSNDPVTLTVTAGSKTVTVSADQSRPDVATSFPALGTNRGFTATLTGLSGAAKVCATATNIDLGVDSALDCIDVTVPTGNPIGSLDDVTALPDGKVSLAGWGLDPDVLDPVSVRISVNGTVRSTMQATSSRPEIGTAYPAYGADRGFAATVSGLTPGSAKVCVTLLNAGAGANTALACRTVTVPGGTPFGSFDLATSPSRGTVTVSGWAIDPDTANPIAVHVYANKIGAAFTANESRPDVAAAYRGYGDRHGYTGRITNLARGSYNVCVYAINVGAGANTLIRCRTVTVS